MMAPSPIATCPPKVAPFTSVTLSPMSQSWAMWAADHQEAIGADLGRHVAALGARIDRDILADQRVRHRW